MFAGKHGFITPRDLFKWAGRGAVGYQQLAEAGYMLLAERLREPAEREVVAQVLQAVMRVQVRAHASAGVHVSVCSVMPFCLNSSTLHAFTASVAVSQASGVAHLQVLLKDALAT